MKSIRNNSASVLCGGKRVPPVSRPERMSALRASAIARTSGLAVLLIAGVQNAAALSSLIVISSITIYKHIVCRGSEMQVRALWRGMRPPRSGQKYGACRRSSDVVNRGRTPALIMECHDSRSHQASFGRSTILWPNLSAAGSSVGDGAFGDGPLKQLCRASGDHALKTDMVAAVETTKRTAAA